MLWVAWCGLIVLASLGWFAAGLVEGLVIYVWVFGVGGVVGLWCGSDWFWVGYLLVGCVGLWLPVLGVSCGVWYMFLGVLWVFCYYCVFVYLRLTFEFEVGLALLGVVAVRA